MVRRSTEEIYSASPCSDAAALIGARVLVVEDEILIAMEIASILEECGAEVIGPAHTLDEALREATSQEISVAILDMYLGRSAVTPVAQSLEQRGVPFLFYSGQPASDPVRTAWESKITLSKPARPRELTGVLATLVAEKSH